jgi:disulfide bond formation protein DsbB
MAASGLVCLIWLAHHPGVIGRRIYAALSAIAALIGAAIAARQVWIMHLPPDQVPACGPGLNYLIQIMPLQKVVATVLRGDASCATVKGSFLGISLPAWSCLYFIALSLWTLAGVFRPATRQYGTPRAIH